jgi:hypothetical protein
MFLIIMNLKGKLCQINYEGVSPLPELCPHGGHPVSNGKSSIVEELLSSFFFAF